MSGAGVENCLLSQCLSLISSQNISAGTQNPEALGGYNQRFLITGIAPFLLYTDCAIPQGFPKSQSALLCRPCPLPAPGHNRELIQLFLSLKEQEKQTVLPEGWSQMSLQSAALQ